LFLTLYRNCESGKKGGILPQSLSKIILHIVFSTKYRVPLLYAEFENEMYRYLAAACKSHQSHILKIGGAADHIHIATTLPRTVTVSELLEEIKKSSSKWYKEKDLRLRDFEWQRGYAAFSVSESQVKYLSSYIEKQREHHRKRTFQEEFRRFLKLYNVEYDERYVWD
jgi:putative transposase